MRAAASSARCTTAWTAKLRAWVSFHGGSACASGRSGPNRRAGAARARKRRRRARLARHPLARVARRDARRVGDVREVEALRAARRSRIHAHPVDRLVPAHGVVHERRFPAAEPRANRQPRPRKLAPGVHADTRIVEVAERPPALALLLRMEARPAPRRVLEERQHEATTAAIVVAPLLDRAAAAHRLGPEDRVHTGPQEGARRFRRAGDEDGGHHRVARVHRQTPGRTSGLDARSHDAVRHCNSTLFSSGAYRVDESSRRDELIAHRSPGVSCCSSPTSRSISAHHGRHLVRDAERRQHAPRVDDRGLHPPHHPLRRDPPRDSPPPAPP